MATAVPGSFTRAAPGESLGRIKPGAQWDSRRSLRSCRSIVTEMLQKSHCVVFVRNID